MTEYLRGDGANVKLAFLTSGENSREIEKLDLKPAPPVVDRARREAGRPRNASKN